MARSSPRPLRVIEGGIFRGRIETVTRPFTFLPWPRAMTSARSATWSVAVVPPPALKDVTLTLVAPEYTGLHAPAVMAPGRHPGSAPRRGDPDRGQLHSRTEASQVVGPSAWRQPLRPPRSSSTRRGLHRFHELLQRQGLHLRSGSTCATPRGSRLREAVPLRPAAHSATKRPESSSTIRPTTVTSRPQATIPVTFTVDDDYAASSPPGSSTKWPAATPSRP